MMPAILGYGFKGYGADRPSTRPANLAESVLAAESEEKPAMRPTTLLTVQGGDSEIFYRGWPIRIVLRSLDTAAETPAPALTVRGPVDVTPQAASHATAVWLISPEKSAAMVAGRYVFSVGAQSSEVVVAGEPAALSTSQQAARQISRVSYALAMDDIAGAEQVARAWVAASPDNPVAQATLGDVLAGAGKSAEALAAYNEAINLTPPGGKPPSHLLKQAAALRRESLAKMATRPADDSSAEEVAYYKLLDEGDAARKAGKYPNALRSYQSAQRYHHDHKLTLRLNELDEKIAYVRGLQKRPTTAPR